jgi:hypothetical protein
MANTGSGLERSRIILSFLRKYGNLTEMQLQAVRDDMQEAVGRIVTTVESINSTSESQKTAAEAEYEKAHLNPDAASKHEMLKVQDEVDSLIDSLMSAPDSVTAGADEAGISRVGSKFSKSVEAISGLHAGLSEPLLNIMGVLSIEDVVGQRLSHVISTMNHFREELAVLLAALKQPFSVETVDAFTTDLLQFAVKQYTIREEKVLFNKLFPRAYREDLINQHSTDVQGVVKLLDFTEAFTQLLGNQLRAVSGEITDTVTTAMASVFAIGSVSETKKKHADTMLVKGSGTDNFVKASIQEAEKGRSAGNSLGTATDALAAMDDELNSRILQMMGDLSIEDVVGQRLEHVITSFTDLMTFTNEVVEHLSSNEDTSVLDQSIQEFLAKIYASYTMESEKRCFRTVFGAPEKLRASV